MQVDNPLQLSHFSSDYTDIADILSADLFAFPSSSSSPSSPSSSLSPKSPLDPFPLLSPRLPLINDSSPSDFFNFNILDDEYTKAPDVFPPPVTSMEPFDFLSSFGASPGEGGGSDSSRMSTFMTNSDDSPRSSNFSMCIDPQLVGSPSVIEEAEEEEEHSPENEPEKKEEQVIPPIKLKGRKGTVQGGGITKKTAVHKDKENTKSFSPVSSRASHEKDDEEGGDDVPSEWRPPPEVYAKMSSKEKRQLRNKISARNFRVRRKEYITTLEGDIAERDRILDAVRSELGSSRSENAALRQEIAALKKALLGGRSATDFGETDIKEVLNLPPPAPLPAQSAAEFLASTAASKPTTSSSDFIAPNTQKDLPTSPRVGSRGFWGGAHIGLGSNITPVHTVIMPEWPPSVRDALQENLNPALNGAKKDEVLKKVSHHSQIGAFEKFTDSTMLTYPSMDPYRMQLWSLINPPSQRSMPKHQQQQQQFTQPHLHGLAANLRPHFFTSSKHNMLPSSSSSYIPGSSLSSLLSGKSRTVASSTSQPPKIKEAASTSPSPAASQSQAAQQQQQRDAMVVALASQTLMGKLGSAFWDAFSGSSTPASSAAPSAPKLDADKVRRVLEGKAVVKVVDVEPATPSKPIKVEQRERECVPCVTDLLEESMRSLSLGKKH